MKGKRTWMIPDPSGDSSEPMIFNKSSIMEPLAKKKFINIQ